MARVPGREPYRVRLHPHGVPGAPGGPAGAVRRGPRFRCSSSGQPVLCPALPRPGTSGGMLAQFMAGMTAGTAPPACPRRWATRWATRCRQVTPGAVLAVCPAHGPGADALAGEDVLGHGDLLGRGGQVGGRGVPAAAVGEPGLLGELQAAVKAVAGVDGPVTARLTG